MDSSLSLNLGHVALIGQLLKADSVVRKIAVELSFVFDVLVRDDSVIELFVVTEILTLVTAAGEDRVNDEQDRSEHKENGVLQDVAEQEHIDVVFLLQRFQEDFIRVMFSVDCLLADKYDVDSVPKNSCRENPFDYCGNCETLVLTELLHAAKSETTVDSVVNAEAARFVEDFAFKPKVRQQVIVHYIVNGQDHADGQHDEHRHFLR